MWLGQVLILQAIHTLCQKRARTYETIYIITRIFLHAEDFEFICTHTHGDHAQIQNYNDGTYCKRTTAYVLPT